MPAISPETANSVWGILASVICAVGGKATGSIYRIKEANASPEPDNGYTARRELEMLGLVGLFTLVIQVLAYPAAKRLTDGVMALLGKTTPQAAEGLIRLMLFSPALFASERMGRWLAGQKRHDALLAFNDHIAANWRKQLALAGTLPLRNLAVARPAMPALSVTLPTTTPYAVQPPFAAKTATLSSSHNKTSTAAVTTTLQPLTGDSYSTGGSGNSRGDQGLSLPTNTTTVSTSAPPSGVSYMVTKPATMVAAKPAPVVLPLPGAFVPQSSAKAVALYTF
jgi:hypothetical protein